MDGTKTVAYKDIWKVSNCRKLLISNLINRFGDAIDSIAFVWLVYQITGSATWSAIVFACNQLPGILILPIAGAWVEGKNKKKIIAFTDIIRGIVVAGFAGLYLVKMVNPYLMVGFTLLITMIESINEPATSAFVTELVEKEKFATLHALKTTATQLVQLMGMLLAGFMIAGIGISGVMFVDAVTFFAGALIMMSIHHKGASEDMDVGSQSCGKKLLEGFRYIWLKKRILYFCFLTVILNLTMAPLNALLTPLVSSVYQKDAGFLSIITAMQFAGTIVASLMIPQIATKFSFDKTVGLLGMLEGMATLLLSLGNLVKGSMIHSYGLAGSSMFMIGFSVALLSGLLSIHLVNMIETDYMARTIGSFNALATSSLPLGTFFVTIATLHFRTATIVSASGMMSVVIFFVIWVKNIVRKSMEGVYAA